MFADLRMKVEYPFKRWVAWWFGVPPDPSRQFQFYRCQACLRIVSWRQITEHGGCSCNMSSRVRAAKLSLLDKTRLLVFPWTV